jgi:uncharacterized protein
MNVKAIPFQGVRVGWYRLPSEDVVDAALIGLDQGELVTIPPRQDDDEWFRYEAARQSLSKHLRHAKLYLE